MRDLRRNMFPVIFKERHFDLLLLACVLLLYYNFFQAMPLTESDGRTFNETR